MTRYTIREGSRIWSTTDTDRAEAASDRGARVTAVVE